MATNKTIHHFLLVYSFDDRKLVHQDEFTDGHQATQAYNEAEHRYREMPNFEIVLVGSDSIETVMMTHGHYFRSASDDSQFSSFLADAVER